MDQGTRADVPTITEFVGVRENGTVRAVEHPLTPSRLGEQAPVAAMAAAGELPEAVDDNALTRNSTGNVQKQRLTT